MISAVVIREDGIKRRLGKLEAPQADLEGLTLVSRDVAMGRYDEVAVLW